MEEAFKNSTMDLNKAMEFGGRFMDELRENTIAPKTAKKIHKMIKGGMTSYKKQIKEVVKEYKETSAK